MLHKLFQYLNFDHRRALLAGFQKQNIWKPWISQKWRKWDYRKIDVRTGKKRPKLENPVGRASKRRKKKTKEYEWSDINREANRVK